MELNLKVTRIYKANSEATTPVVLNIGGARSSKSYSILQLFLVRFLSCVGRKMLVTRKTGPALKATAYSVFLEMLQETGLYSEVEHNKTDKTFTYRRNLIAFISLDDPLKIRSSSWNDVMMEEANEFEWPDYITLKTRMSAPKTDGLENTLYLALNPSDETGWIHQRLEAMPSVTVIRSTHKDNPFLSSEYRRILEDLKDEDETFYKVFTLGEWATPTEIIYPSWSLVDEAPDHPDEVIYGVDFGFNNPSAIVKISIKDMVAVCEELLYESKLTNQELIARFRLLVGETMDPIYCDSDELGRIQEFCDAGYNAFPADKDVALGIDTVKRYKIAITKASTNAIKEIRNYKWKKDRAGNVLDEPVKYLDHLMDGTRYALHTHTGERFLTEEDLKGIEIEELDSIRVSVNY